MASPRVLRIPFADLRAAPAGALAAVPVPGPPPEPPPAPAEAAAGPPPPELIEIEGPLLEADTWKRVGDDLLAKSIDFVPSLIKALIVLLALYLVYRALAGLIGGVLRSTRADAGLRTITIRLLRYTLLGLAMIMALGQLGFNIASVLAGVGIVGLAVGLAAQETVANLIAGLTILWDRPFRIGDNVTIAGTFGKVRSIGLRTTRIQTVERLDCILPNREVVEQKIINHTMSPEFRLPVRVGIAYREDTRKAREVLIAAVRGHELILDEPAPVVVVTALGESSVTLELRVWLRDPYSEREAHFDLLEIVKIALDEAGIEIPFPQRTLHFGPGAMSLRIEKDEATAGGEAGHDGGEDA